MIIKVSAGCRAGVAAGAGGTNDPPVHQVWYQGPAGIAIAPWRRKGMPSGKQNACGEADK